MSAIGDLMKRERISYNQAVERMKKDELSSLALPESSASGCTEAAKSYANRRTIESAIEEAASDLPEGWKIVLSMERGAVWVEAVRPDETVAPIDDPDGDIYDWIREAGRLAVDETKADSLPNKEATNDHD